MATYSARTLITTALEDIAVVGDGETVPAAKMASGLQRLNTILGNLFALGIGVFATTKENFTLTANDPTYTIGSGGDFDTVRPNQVLGGFIRIGTTDHPVTTIFERDYRRLSLKSLTGRPRQVFYQPEYPLGIINLFYTPDSAYDYHIWMNKPLAEISSLSTALTLPPEYKLMLETRLAIISAPRYGKRVPRELKDTAREAYDNVVSLNAARQSGPVDLDVSYFNNSYGYGAYSAFHSG